MEKNFGTWSTKANHQHGQQSLALTCPELVQPFQDWSTCILILGYLLLTSTNLGSISIQRSQQKPEGRRGAVQMLQGRSAAATQAALGGSHTSITPPAA